MKRTGKLSALKEVFSYQNQTIHFSSMTVSIPLTEQEKRILIFTGIAEIDNLPQEERDFGESSFLHLDFIDTLLAQAIWKEPRYLVFIYVHQEMPLQYFYSYMQSIQRRITALTNIACGLVDIPRALFQGLERVLHTQSDFPPLTTMRN